MGNKQELTPKEAKVVYVDDEIDLAELLRTLWRRKLSIILWTALFAGLVFLYLVKQVVSPPVATVTQQFSLKFPGIEDNKYPNGLPFSLAELTANQILEKAFAENTLEQYGLKRADIRDNIVTNKSVEGLRFLEQKYQALLDQKGLTPEERQQLQEEYQAQRQKLFAAPFYKISWQYKTGKVPQEVQEKVLLDILSLWAQTAEEQKGVYLYQVPVVSTDAFYFEDVNEEYIVKVDMLRHVVEQVKANLEEIKELPGALLVETASGAKLTSLQIRTNDLLNYQLAPLTGLIRSGGLHVNKELAQIYTQEQLYNLKLQKGVLQGEMALLSDALDGYINSNDQFIARKQSEKQRLQQNGNLERSTVIPQIGDRFLDQLVALANDNQDVAYRQEITTKMVEVGNRLLKVEKDITYYEELLKARDAAAGKATTLLEEFKRKNKRAIAEAKKITAETNELYQLVSQDYLKVSEALYQLQGPAQYQLARATSVKKVAVIGLAAVIVFFFMVCILVLLASGLAGRRDD